MDSAQLSNDIRHATVTSAADDMANDLEGLVKDITPASPASASGAKAPGWRAAWNKRRDKKRSSGASDG